MMVINAIKREEIGANKVRFTLPCKGQNPNNPNKLVKIMWDCTISRNAWKFKAAIVENSCNFTN